MNSSQTSELFVEEPNTQCCAPRHLQPRQPVRRVVWRHAKNGLMNVAAVLGLLCVVLVIVGLTSGMSLIMFRTGSMAPTIPAGSLALVQQIGADDIRLSDVITVDRPGELPVTHRVVTVDPDTEGDAQFRSVVMRGDANDVNDALPYRVDEVRRVLGSVPGLAPIVVWFSQPLVLGVIAVGAAVMVTASFWPSSAAGARRRRYAERSVSRSRWERTG